MSRATQIAAFMMLAAVIGTLSAVSAADDKPANFVTLKLEGACDDANRRLWLANTHTFKTVAATVRWRAAGGKDLTDQFYSGPNSIRELGCAAEAEILEVTFAEF